VSISSFASASSPTTNSASHTRSFHRRNASLLLFPPVEPARVALGGGRASRGIAGGDVRGGGGDVCRTGRGALDHRTGGDPADAEREEGDRGEDDREGENPSHRGDYDRPDK